MKRYVSSDFSIGVLGGGQLGRMLIQAASNLDVNIKILDPNPNGPAAKMAYSYTQGDFRDYNAVLEFGKNCDLITVEIEDVNTDALRELIKQGKEVQPLPGVLDLIRDKGTQKQFYQKNGIPTAPFALFVNAAEIITAVNSGNLAFPFVQKLRTGGYDGKGVAIINSAKDLKKLLHGPSVIEQAANIKKEIGVIVAGSNANNIPVCYPPVEMLFDPNANLVEFLSAPADIPENIAKEAEKLATKLYKKMGMRGLLAVEMFWNMDGSLWINEVAPRPHNSGHHSIEANPCSQFEQHLRSILNWPLGSTKQEKAAVMINLLGDEFANGEVYYKGLDELLSLEGVYPHIYGKREVSPYRKMGHVTVLADTREQAVSLGKTVKELITVKGV